MGLTIQDRLHHKSAYKSRNMSLRNTLLSPHLPSEVPAGQHEGEEGARLESKPEVIDNSAYYLVFGDKSVFRYLANVA
jgi:hypothetical protein